MNYQELHSSGIGSGDIAAVAGVDPYTSRMDVWEEKTGLCVVDGKVVEQTEPRADKKEWYIDRGRFLEPAIVAWVQDRLGIDLHPGRTFRLGGSPEIIATPDALTADAEPVEVKSPGEWGFLDWGDDETGANGVPARVIIQNHWQMIAAERDCGIVGALIGGFPRVYRLKRNDDLCTKLMQSANDFWGHVQSRTPPPVDTGKPGHAWLAKSYPRHSGDEKAAPIPVEDAEHRELCRSYVEAYRLAKDAEADADALAAKVKEAIGLGAGFTGDFGKLLYRADKRGKVNYKKAFEALAIQTAASQFETEEIIEAHRGKAPRPLRTYPSKETPND